MRVATLNIRHGGGTRAGRLLDYIGTLSADVLVLTEFREGENSRRLRSALVETGHLWQAASSFVPRENCVFISANAPFVSGFVESSSGVEPHMLLHARFAGINVVGAYFPQNEAKRPVFDFLASNVGRLLGGKGLLIGDLNTGRHYVDENGKSFSCADCFDTLESAGLVDSWRTRNPTRSEFSWYSAHKNGFRLDHALCTRSLDAVVTGVRYDHSPRVSGATDHSALIIEFGELPAELLAS